MTNRAAFFNSDFGQARVIVYLLQVVNRRQVCHQPAQAGPMYHRMLKATPTPCHA